MKANRIQLDRIKSFKPSVKDVYHYLHSFDREWNYDSDDIAEQRKVFVSKNFIDDIILPLPTSICNHKYKSICYMGRDFIKCEKCGDIKDI